MPHAQLDAEEIARRGKALYEGRLRPSLEAGNDGKILVINVDTGEYELGEDHLTVSDRAALRFPGAPLFAMRIGRKALGRIGARFKPVRR